MKTISYWKRKLESCKSKEEIATIFQNAIYIEVQGVFCGNSAVKCRWAKVVLGVGGDDEEVYYASAGAKVGDGSYTGYQTVSGDTVKIINEVLSDMLSDKKIAWSR